MRLRRSALYVPASNARALDKARGLAADVVIIDLEDAVAPEAKAAARERAVRLVEEGAFGPREVVIRCNGLATPWGAEDLAAAAQAAPDAVLVPKIKAARDLAAYGAALASAVPIWAMVETCGAVLCVGDIAAHRKAVRLEALVLGTNDLLAEIRARAGPGREPLQTAMSLTVMAARASGLAVLDGVHNVLSDEGGFSAACRQARDSGFDGKTLIHPSQIDACNRAFTPTDEELAAARAIIAAFARAGNGGAIAVNGRMVEGLHLIEAQRIVAAWQAATGA